MDYVLPVLLLITLHSSAFGSQNDSSLVPRTFSGHRISIHDDPVDYLDLSMSDSFGDSGSGLSPEHLPVKKYGSHHQPNQYTVSDEAKEFLHSFLATHFIPTFYILVFFVSIPLNLVAVVMFMHFIRPRKPAVIYMLNLSCADLFFGLLLPFKMAYHYHKNDWIYGDFMCRAVTGAFYCNMYCSVLLITCISVDRFLAVVYPINSLTWRSPRTASAVCGTIWLLAFGGVSPLFASEQTLYLPELGITTCHDVQDDQKLQSYYQYFFPVYAIIFFFIPLVITVVCYVKVIQALKAANVQNRSKKTRAVVMTMLVLVMFIVCFTPTNVILLVHYMQLYHRPDFTYRAYLLSLCIGSLSCCLDPLLYYFGSSQCQKQVLVMFRGKRLGRTGSKSIQTNSTRSSGCNNSSRSNRMESLSSQYSHLPQ